MYYELAGSLGMNVNDKLMSIKELDDPEGRTHTEDDFGAQPTEVDQELPLAPEDSLPHRYRQSTSAHRGSVLPTRTKTANEKSGSNRH